MGTEEVVITSVEVFPEEDQEASFRADQLETVSGTLLALVAAEEWGCLEPIKDLMPVGEDLAATDVEGLAVHLEVEVWDLEMPAECSVERLEIPVECLADRPEMPVECLVLAIPAVLDHSAMISPTLLIMEAISLEAWEVLAEVEASLLVTQLTSMVSDAGL